MISNPKTLKDYILRTLGAPIINVEVTEEQIYDCIQRSLDMFGMYHYDGTNKAYAVYKLSKEEAATGVLDMRGKNVFAVTKIIRAKQSMYATFGGTPYNWFSDMVLGFAGGVGMGSGNSFYSPYSPFGGGMSYFTQLSSYFVMMEDQFDPLPDYWFNEASGQLYITSNQFAEGDVVVCEVYVTSYSDVDRMIPNTIGYGTVGCDEIPDYIGSYFNPDINIPTQRVGKVTSEPSQGAYNNIWIKEYATALVKELNGYILSKHQGMQLPGGVTIDGYRMMDDARQDKQRLEQEIMLLDTAIPVILG